MYETLLNKPTVKSNAQSCTKDKIIVVLPEYSTFLLDIAARSQYSQFSKFHIQNINCIGRWSAKVCENKRQTLTAKHRCEQPWDKRRKTRAGIEESRWQMNDKNVSFREACSNVSNRQTSIYIQRIDRVVATGPTKQFSKALQKHDK